MRSTRVLPALIIGMVIGSGACSLLTDPSHSVVGVVEWVQDGAAVEGGGMLRAVASDAAGGPMELPVLEAPDTVEAGQAFDILVRTYGPDGCWREDGAVASVTGLVATVTPYDRDRGAEDRSRACADMVVRLPRTVRLVFTEPGEAVLRVLGRRVVPTDVELEAGVAVIEHRVVVRTSATGYQ
jgi:hypothetical protein